jgi:hypothetical protein
MNRKNDNMKWKKCSNCGLRIYFHRVFSHICMENELIRSPTIKDNSAVDTIVTPDISGKAYLNRDSRIGV